MCTGDDAHPPLPPVRGGAGDFRDLVLTASDGNAFDAHLAHPDAGSTKGMVVLPDIRGLHDFYRELARRFAEAGMNSVAMDYFGRTAGQGTSRAEGFEFRPHVEQLKPDTLTLDISAAADLLRSEEGGGCESVFTVGFCMGGAVSWGQAAAGLGLAGCIGFYGQPARVEDRIPDMKAPLLILVAGADFTPVSAFEEFAGKLEAAGVAHDMHVYEGAPHSFFDRGFDQHAEACDDAWRRILAFVEQYG